MLPVISLDRQTFRPPDRAGLPELRSYATLRLADGTERVVGYTEASRGCKHLCRHCPIVPVYGGRFRVVQRDVVDADIAALVRAGAQHITFGDPDFFNGPAHAMAVVARLHARFPTLSYDVTIKVEHLLSRAAVLPALRDTGCVLITTAVESFDDAILEVFDKRHTRADLVTALRLLGEAGIAVNPTFVAFTPWTARETYVDFLSAVCDLGLVETVSAVQYAIRLLVPTGSRLLDVSSLQRHLRHFDAVGLCHQWAHPDPLMDRLQVDLFAIAEEAISAERSRRDVFDRVREHTADLFGGQAARRLRGLRPAAGVTPSVPYLSEPWFCCAEPVRGQLEPML